MLSTERKEDDLRGIYNNVKSAMKGIHNKTSNKGNTKELKRIANEW